MKPNISKDEFRIMAYLHENAKGFSEDFPFKPEDVAPALGIKIDQLQKHVSYLTGHGLIGTFQPQFLHYGDNRSDWELYLTSSGEDFMRELDEMLVQQLEAAPDAEPGTVQKITLKVAGFVYDLGKAVIVKVLADSMTGKH